MAVNVHPSRWSLEEYLHVWEGGGFGKRAELLDGEVYDEVGVGTWHARTAGSTIRALPNGAAEILPGSLAANQSLPEPDCWVLRRGAQPVEQLSRRMARWAARDVLLVVEVSDETKDYDLGRKSVIYAEAGFGPYWVMTEEGIYVHDGPTGAGYTRRVLHRLGDEVAVPYAPDVTLAVSDLLAPVS